MPFRTGWVDRLGAAVALVRETVPSDHHQTVETDELQKRDVGVDLVMLLCRQRDSETVGPFAESTIHG